MSPGQAYIDLAQILENWTNSSSANMAAMTIDTSDALKSFLEALPGCKGNIPSLYINLEGNNLSKEGTLSLSH
jgi:hypothetical protein